MKEDTKAYKMQANKRSWICLLSSYQQCFHVDQQGSKFSGQICFDKRHLARNKRSSSSFWLYNTFVAVKSKVIQHQDNLHEPSLLPCPWIDWKPTTSEEQQKCCQKKKKIHLLFLFFLSLRHMVFFVSFLFFFIQGCKAMKPTVS